MENQPKTIRTDQFTVRIKEEALQTEMAKEIERSGLDSGSAYFLYLFRRRGQTLPVASLDDRLFIEAAIKSKALADESAVYAASLQILRQLITGADLADPELVGRFKAAATPAAPIAVDEINQLVAIAKTLPTCRELQAELKAALDQLSAASQATDETKAGVVAIRALIESQLTRSDLNEVLAEIRKLKPTADASAFESIAARINDRLSRIDDTYSNLLDRIATAIHELPKPTPATTLAPVERLLAEQNTKLQTLVADNAALRKSIGPTARKQTLWTAILVKFVLPAAITLIMSFSAVSAFRSMPSAVVAAAPAIDQTKLNALKQQEVELSARITEKNKQLDVLKQQEAELTKRLTLTEKHASLWKQISPMLVTDAGGQLFIRIPENPFYLPDSKGQPNKFLKLTKP